MAAQKCEISLRVFSTREEKFRFFDEIPNHFTLIAFGVKGAIY